MMITLNGQKHELEKALTVAELLQLLSVQKEKVVVELNLEILSRDTLSQTPLRDGDTVEIVQFVGGGAEGEIPAPEPAEIPAAAKPKRAAPKKSRATPAARPGKGGLVIVESPAKCKTINKYLGPDFEVAASMGHVIDLPKSRMGIDLENNFEPQYIVVRDRKKTLDELKKKAKSKAAIYLACDPDREGEAISWHLMNALGEGKAIHRVVFNEITKDAVQEAFKKPGHIDLHLVGAQQARRVLDRIVGYSLSPLLWQKVGRGLSAGRVQSVALRLIVDREREIRAFIPEEYWSVEARLKKESGDPAVIEAKLEKIGEDKAELKKEPEAKAAVQEIRGERFVVEEVRRTKKKRNPYPPFTTSKLQQAAYNRFRFPASKTMRIAQSLYEGVEIGAEGAVGLITYMRTDSVRLSDQALKETREFITQTYGKDFLPDTPNIYKSKKSAQEAHEAIRPTSVHRRLSEIESFLSPDEAKLYGLIWEQTVASQMVPAIIAQETADIRAGRFLFRASGSRVEFAGCLIVSGRDEEADQALPPMEAGESLTMLSVDPLQHFTKPPARYTDASLVKALEERGIGRPSTYAPIIGTLTERDYIRREGGALVPTELGILVTDLLVKHFSKILDVEFTAGMEEELDEVEEGKMEWPAVVRSFYEIFRVQIELAKSQMQTVKREAEPTDELCEKCGKPMVIKWGRRGRFMSCSAWPDCKNAKSVPTAHGCPQCGTGKLVERRAKSGRGRPFYGCSRYPECTFIANKLPSKASASGTTAEAEPVAGEESPGGKAEPASSDGVNG